MDEKYNIDDILSEVKKRREEEVKAQAEPKAPEQPPMVDEPKEVPAEATPQAQDAAEKEINDEAADEPEKVPEEIPETAGDAAEPEEEKMVNLVDLAEEDDAPFAVSPEKAESSAQHKGMSQKTRKKIITALSIILVLVIIAGATVFIVANNMINDLVDNNDSTVATTETEWSGMDKLEESFEPINEKEATELASLQDMIRDWYYNGTPCRSTHVLNVLLIGEDTRGKEILDEGTRADSAIIVSLNIDTKQITLTSILRDAWAYWETEKGNAETGQFGKINGAMSTGDINAYINCLENLYKIQIDNYAIVNFDSFESIVDELGGVTLKITEAEINEINNHQKRYGHVTIEKEFEGKSGKQKLSGKEALAYCRIRKLDSDNMRADRQKTCLIQIFNQTKKASTVKLLKIVKALIPYVKTNMGKSEIVKIAKYAFTQGWLDFDTYMQNLPENNLKGGTYYGQWVWRPDYPADAYYLQSIVYGKSSITLAHIRPDTAKCPERGFCSEGSSAMYTTITNNNYGELTVVETTTKKEDSE